MNTTVFDYNGQLQTGKLTLYAWPIESELEESVHYMGSTVLNPSTTECVSLEIEVMAPILPPTMRPGAPIMYPSTERIHELATEVSTVAATVVSSLVCLWGGRGGQSFVIFVDYTQYTDLRDSYPAHMRKGPGVK